MLGWHFLREDRRLQYPPHTLVEVGQTLTVEPPLKLCTCGLHLSERAIDALNYAPGPIVCRVEGSGEILVGDDKAAATKRTVLWMVDATNTLHEFACWCAEQALLREREAGREPDPRSWAAIETKRRWLRGEATDKELAAARDAAWAAARAAARAAAWYAAWASAWASAWYAAWDATRDVQNAKLEEMLNELAG